jgi:small subunit ribosomal protein S16
MVRIRLKRMGRRNRPFYRINAVEKRTQRDGKILENLGWYDPMAPDASKQIEVKAERVQHWLALGAQPTDTVNDILAREGVIDADAWKAERESRTRKNRAAAIKAAEEKAAAEKAAAEAEAAAKKAEAEAAAAAPAEEAAPEA